MGLLAYSGITTKVRAMESRLLKPEQFRELAEQEDVRSAADYLKEQPAYAEVFDGLDDTKLHRGYIEQILTQSEYRDFTRLYRFSSMKQRKFLDLYFKHYEVEVIKKLLRHMLGGREGQTDLSMFQGFFEKHSELDLETLCRAKNFSEFTEALEGTVYGKLLSQMQEKGQTGLFDCELKLDLFYFQLLWKLRNKLLSKTERKILDDCFGSRLDLLNIQWICRARSFYRLSQAEIYALLIPVHYRLRADKVKQLVEAEDDAKFFAVLRETPYGKQEELQTGQMPDIQLLSNQMLNRIYGRTGHRYPHSPAVLDSYLYRKELEMRKIVTALEGIRYGLPASEIMGLLAKQ
ncbi:MAG: V-type ATPase subunit [Lachnospiraceae bacterium]